MPADDEHSDEEKDRGMAFDRASLHAAIEGVVSGHPDVAAAVYEAFPEI